MPFYHQIYRNQDGVSIIGTFLEAFIHNGRYYVTPIKIYKDGLIDCGEPRLVDIEMFRDKVRKGSIVVHPPEGARIAIGTGSTFFTATDVKCNVEPEEFIKEVEDEIKRLNKQPTSAHHCLDALTAFKAQPSGENKEALRVAYEAVPKHLRRFLGDMDTKDWEYRQILGLTP